MGNPSQPPIINRLRKLSQEWFATNTPERKTIEDAIADLRDYKWESDFLRKENLELEKKLAAVGKAVEMHV